MNDKPTANANAKPAAAAAVPMQTTDTKMDVKHSQPPQTATATATATATGSDGGAAPMDTTTTSAGGVTTTTITVKTRGLVDRPDLNHTIAPPAPSHPASAKVVNPWGTNTDASVVGSALGGTATGVKLPHKKHTAEDNAKFGAFVEQKIIKSVHPNCVVELCLPPNWDEKAAAAKPNAAPASNGGTGTGTGSGSGGAATAAAGAAMGGGAKKPAKEYKFTLDAFQRESIACLERNQSVLVSAHTSAGKTVVAEYVLLALQHTYS